MDHGAAARNQYWTLARRPPGGWPTDEDFAWNEAPAPAPGADQMLTRTIYLSLDPYQWTRRRSGSEAPGDICHGRTVSQVVESRIRGFREGDFVFNTNGWQNFGLTGAGVSVFNYMFPRRIDPSLAPISTAVGVLGMLGLTAYAGLVVQCAPQAGETVVVAAASGGVGQIVGQLAKLRGCRTVGIAGRREKCDFVRDALGFDACVSHLNADFPDQVRAACPDGIDVYFENVGGAVFDAVLPQLNRNARVTLCGLASQYGLMGGDMISAWQAQGSAVFAAQAVVVHRLFVGDFVATHQTQFLDDMAGWLKDRRITYREDVSQGLETAPEAFHAMLSGRSFGKALVLASRDPTRV